MRRIWVSLAGLAVLSLQACATASPSALQTVTTGKSCQAQGLVFTRDKNGKGVCVTEAQAACQANALLVLGDADCLNSLIWKADAPTASDKP